MVGGTIIEMSFPNDDTDDTSRVPAAENVDAMAIQCYPREPQASMHCPRCGTLFSQEPVRLLNHSVACCVTAPCIVLCLGCIVPAVLLANVGGSKCDGLTRVFGHCKCTPGSCIGCNTGILCQGSCCNACSLFLCSCCYSNYFVCSQCKTMSKASDK